MLGNGTTTAEDPSIPSNIRRPVASCLTSGSRENETPCLSGTERDPDALWLTALSTTTLLPNTGAAALKPVAVLMNDGSEEFELPENVGNIPP